MEAAIASTASGFSIVAMIRMRPSQSGQRKPSTRSERQSKSHHFILAGRSGAVACLVLAGSGGFGRIRGRSGELGARNP